MSTPSTPPAGSPSNGAAEPAPAVARPADLPLDSQAEQIHTLIKREARALNQIRKLRHELQKVWDHAHRLHDTVRAYERAMQAQKQADEHEVVYDKDGLRVRYRSVAFLEDEKFHAAFQAGMRSWHHVFLQIGGQRELPIEWRVYLLCWAARHASTLDGDFVECGVNTGIYSLAACHYVEFNSLDRDFYLLDPFVSPIVTAEAFSGAYYDVVRNSFSRYPRVHVIQTELPPSLADLSLEKIAYLSLDVAGSGQDDEALQEASTLELLWERLVPGAVVVLGKYGWLGYPRRKIVMDALAARLGIEIGLLPTGQGLIVR